MAWKFSNIVQTMSTISSIDSLIMFKLGQGFCTISPQIAQSAESLWDIQVSKVGFWVGLISPRQQQNYHGSAPCSTFPIKLRLGNHILTFILHHCQQSHCHSGEKCERRNQVIKIKIKFYLSFTNIFKCSYSIFIKIIFCCTKHLLCLIIYSLRKFLLLKQNTKWSLMRLLDLSKAFPALSQK